MTSPLPSPPNSPGIRIAKHPSDLYTETGGFYTQIQFVPYFDLNTNPDIVPNPMLEERSIRFGPRRGRIPEPLRPPPQKYMNTSNIVLPIPAKLNDVQTVVWTQEGLGTAAASAISQYATSAGLGARLGLLGTGIKALSIATGLQVNPMLWMMFRNPEFKKFIFEWYFTPVNENESYALVKIINYIKYESLPRELNKLIWQYPSLALIRFYPDDEFTFRMKPCAVLQVDVDYTAANMPSFFTNGAPTVIRLRIAVIEIDLWTKDNYHKRH